MFGRSGSKNGNGAIKAIEAEVTRLQQRRDALSMQLSEAERAAGQAHELRRADLISGATENIAARDTACRASDDRCSALADALDSCDSLLGEAQQRLAAERDRVERDQEISLRRAQLDQLRGAIRSYQSAGEQLAAAARALGLCAISSGPVGDYVVASTGGVLQHAEMLRGEAQSYLHRTEASSEVIAGRSAPQAPATSPRLGAPAGIAYRPLAGNQLEGGLDGVGGRPVTEAI